MQGKDKSVDYTETRKEVEEDFRNARMKVEIERATRWGFWVRDGGGGLCWCPTRKRAVAKAKRILQGKLLEEQRHKERFTISEEDLP